MRTREEVIEKMRETIAVPFSFWPQVLAEYLTFEESTPFLKDGADPAGWPDPKPLTRNSIINEMREYMTFAWDKVRDHRGISACRSVEKMSAWLWLMNDDLDLERFPHEQYGAPRLKAVCDKFGFPVPNGADLVNMINGEPCEPDCEQGCGT